MRSPVQSWVPLLRRQLDFKSNCLFSLFYFVDTEKRFIFAAMKQIISTILLFAFAIAARAQDVVKLLEPAYADSAVAYRQSVYVPQKWEKRRVVLFIERPLGATHVRVNGIEAKGDTSLVVPHEVDVTKMIAAGQRNSIEISVDGHDSRGILGAVELRSQPRRLYIKKVKLRPRPYSSYVRLEVDYDGSSPDFSYYMLDVLTQREDCDSANMYVASWFLGSDHQEMDVAVPEKERFWDEFYPNMFRMGLSVADDYQEITYGMREAGVVDGKLFLNRRPIYLRGVMMDDYFPMWGRMPTDVATWEKIFKRLETLGINYVRFRGFCPVDAAFQAADKIGMYLQPEVKSKDELSRVTDVYGRHPSLVLVRFNDADYVWNDGKLTYVVLNQKVIYGSDLLTYKQGIEHRLLNDTVGHYLLGGMCDREGDFSGVLHARWGDGADDLDARAFTQFCRQIVPIARLAKTRYTLSDTLRVPVVVYNAMYGHMQRTRVTYFLHTDSGQVVAGGLVSSGKIPLASQNDVGEIVFPLDSLKHPCTATLTLVVGNTAVRNHWDIEVADSVKSDAGD